MPADIIPAETDIPRMTLNDFLARSSVLGYEPEILNEIGNRDYFASNIAIPLLRTGVAPQHEKTHYNVPAGVPILIGLIGTDLLDLKELLRNGDIYPYWSEGDDPVKKSKELIENSRDTLNMSPPSLRHIKGQISDLMNSPDLEQLVLEMKMFTMTLPKVDEEGKVIPGTKEDVSIYDPKAKERVESALEKINAKRTDEEKIVIPGIGDTSEGAKIVSQLLRGLYSISRRGRDNHSIMSYYRTDAPLVIVDGLKEWPISQDVGLVVNSSGTVHSLNKKLIVADSTVPHEAIIRPDDDGDATKKKTHRPNDLVPFGIRDPLRVESLFKDSITQLAEREANHLGTLGKIA